MTLLDDLTNEQIDKLLREGTGVSQKILSAYEKRLLRDYQKALKEIQSQIAGMYEKYGSKVNLADMDSYSRLTNLEKQITKIVAGLNGQVKSTTMRAIEDIYSNSYYYSGYAMEKGMTTALGFGQLRTEDISRSIFNPLDRITWSKRQLEHHNIYIRQIREEITQGLIQGSGYPKISRNIREKTGLLNNKIKRIVQTETHRVQNQGIIDAFYKSEGAFKRLGIKRDLVWLATLDEKTRDPHRRLDGQKADKDMLFHIDGLTASYPGGFGVPGQDIECRCTTIPQIEGFEPKVRKDNESKKIISYKNYNEWAEGKKIKPPKIKNPTKK